MNLRFIYLLIFSFNLLSGQVSFRAKVSKKTLGINERLQIDFLMNEDGDNFTPPSFENFKVVGGPSQSISNSWINGVRTYSKTYTYFLAPKKRGSTSIGQASIEVKGVIYKTSPIEINVTAAVDVPKDPNDPEYLASESIDLVAEISKTDPYLNEAISVVYKLYIAENTGIRTWNEIDKPRYNDFWSQNIDVKELKVQEGLYKGENYRFVVLKKTVLFPQKTGELSLEPLTLDISVEVPSNRRDIFGRRATTTVNRTVTAGNRIIKVKPLPKQGRPENFSGAVGEFDFKVESSKKTLTASEAFNLKLEVSGKGNLMLFELPEPILPSSLEIYDPEHSEDIKTSLNGTKGRILDNYTIVTNESGQYPIPPISFSFFNPKTKRYETINSEKIIVNASENPYISKNNVDNISQDNISKIESKDSKFSSIYTSTKLEPIEKDDFFKSVLFWLLFITPLFFIPTIIIYTKIKGKRAMDFEGNKIRKNRKLAKKYLSEAKKNIGNKESFYEDLERALHSYLKAKLKIKTVDLSKDRIKSLLDNNSISSSNVTVFVKLLESCDFARYTPLGKSDMIKDYETASEIITQIDKQL
ncbi:MAG: BatD family protein [Flavobacteriaceae bacterium]